MHRVMYTNTSQYVSNRDGIFYYIRRVPHDVRQHYASARISFSLRTKSQRHAFRAADSVTHRLEDYWLGLRLQQMDIPAIHLVKADDVEGNSPLLLDAVEMHLNAKGKTDKTFIRTARRIDKHQKLDRIEAALIDDPDKNVSYMWGQIKRRCLKDNTIAWPHATAAKYGRCSRTQVPKIMNKLMKLGAVTRPQESKRGANSGGTAIYRRKV